jgi:selenocysteine-specific elongation factor
MPTIVVGTAGHIDHGKTSLLRALTGIDADRLPEERERGMTIDVGYAHLDFDDGTSLDFVDVPGHDRLAGNMLVGAGEIDAAMLVVAADDGPRAQTIEHLELLDALEIRDGIVVVTKIDAVEAERVVAVIEAIGGLVAGTSLAGSPVVTASAVTGDGIEALAGQLRELRRRVETRALSRPPGPTRLAIDRAFEVRGRGVVVTGTLRGGSIATGDRLRLEPGEAEGRVREVQVHGSARPGHDGGRTALNVAGFEAGTPRRGAVLTAGPGIESSDRLFVAVRPAAILRGRHGGGGGARRQLPGDGSRLRLHLGTEQVDATVGRRGLGAPELPGGAVTAVLRLGGPVATFVGDRGVLRQPSPGEAVASMRVLDPHPPRGVSRRRLTAERQASLVAAIDDGDADSASDALVGMHGAIQGARIAAVTAALAPRGSEPVGRDGQAATGASSGGLLLADDVVSALEQQAEAFVAAHHVTDVASSGLSLQTLRTALGLGLRRLVAIDRSMTADASRSVDRVVDGLVARGGVAREGDRLRDPRRSAGPTPGLAAAMDRLEAILAVPAPPPLGEAATLGGCPPEGIRALMTAGRIVRVTPQLAWASPTYHELAAQALALARQAPLAPATFRDATGTSRRYVLAILEDLDRRGILQRTAEGHIPGPRAPRPAPEPVVEPAPEPAVEPAGPVP